MSTVLFSQLRALPLMLGALLGAVLGPSLRAAAPDELCGYSGPADSAPLPEGALRLVVYEPVLFDLELESTELASSPGVFLLESPALGAGVLVALDTEVGAYSAYFEVANWAPMTLLYISDSACFELLGAAVPAVLQPAQFNATLASSLPCPPVVRGQVGRYGSILGFGLAVDTWSIPFIATVEFYQFCALTISRGGTLPDGTPWSETLGSPPGALPLGWPMNSNGGGGDPPDLVTGRGLMDGTGATVYADALVGVGRYPTAVSRGSLSAMVDAPRPPPALQSMLGTSADGRPVGWIRWRLDLWTYVVLDGQVAYVVIWHSDWTISLPSGELLLDVTIDAEGPATDFAPNHAQALAQHAAGSYGGVLR